MADDIRLGRKHKLYYNAGTYGSPVWALVPYVRNVTVGMTFGETDVNSRASEFELRDVGLTALSVDFEMLERDGDAAYTTIRDAAWAKTAVEFMLLNGSKDVSGSKGFRATCKIFGFGHGEPLAEAKVVSVNIKPTDSDHDPEKVTI